MAEPSISVVIPTFGRAQYLEATLESVVQQTYAPFEIIVVDDCSPAPVMLPRRLDGDVIVLRHSRNQGPGAARNTGMAHARGDWIAFLDDDDLFTPTRLEQAVSGMGDRRTHASAVELFYPDGSAELYRSKYFEGDLTATFHHGPHPSMGQTVFHREDVPQFNPSLRVSEDTEWWLRLSHAADFAWSPSVGLRKRRHPEARPGVRSDSRLRARSVVYALHADDVDRRTKARLAGNVAAEAILNRKHLTGLMWSARSLMAFPTALNGKRLLRSLILPRRSSS